MRRRVKQLVSFGLSFVPDVLKPPLYGALLGAKLGKDVKIGPGSVIVADRVELGDGTRIGALTHIDSAELKTGHRARIGNMTRITAAKTELKSRSVIDSWVVVVGDRNEREHAVISLGRESWIFPRCHVNLSRPVTIGKNVSVGGGSYIFTHGYWLSALDGFPVQYAPVTIHDDTYVPWSCFVTPGVEIGSRVVVGAGSLINKDVPDDAFVAGVPAKVIRERSSRVVELPEKLAMLEEITRHYARYTGTSYGCDEHPGSRRLLVGGVPLLVLHSERALASSAYDGSALNVIPGPLDVALARERPCLFLDGYGSSSEALLGDRALDWLRFARRIGLRFYPWDEE